MSAPYIINIESATEVCSVSLQSGTKHIFTATSAKELSAANRLPLLIETCLQYAGLSFEELDAVSVSEGPGSYTGLRIGMSLAKGICMAMQIPMITISSLEILASGAIEENPQFEGLILPMIDARRMEVYTAGYSTQLSQLIETRSLILTESILMAWIDRFGQLLLCGNGSTKVKSFFPNINQLNYGKSALSSSNMIPISANKWAESMFSEINFTSPKYLKSANITTPKKRF